MQSIQPCLCLYQVSLTWKMSLDKKKGILVQMGGVKEGREKIKTV